MQKKFRRLTSMQAMMHLVRALEGQVQVQIPEVSSCNELQLTGS
jgi:hypothetical protein